jgi:hypothetical protein
MPHGAAGLLPGSFPLFAGVGKHLFPRDIDCDRGRDRNVR